MSLVLGIDTHGPWCAVALVQDDKTLAHVSKPMTKGQAEHLMPLIQTVLDDAGLEFTDLDGIGVCTGPGNFTGVRIAVSAARGLSLATGVPAIGFSTFDVMRAALNGEGSQPILVSLPAPRGALYLQAFVDEVAVGKPQTVHLGQDVIEAPSGAGMVIGADAQDVADVLNRTNPGQWTAQPAQIRGPALQVARLAMCHPTQNTPIRPKPFYVRAADAAPPSDQPVQILP